MKNIRETDQKQHYQNYQQTPLPNSTAVLVLGIVSIVGCFGYGIIGVITGIISLVLAKKDLVRHNLNPSLYTQSSHNNLKAGRKCAIVGLILSALYLLVAIILLAWWSHNAIFNLEHLIENL